MRCGDAPMEHLDLTGEPPVRVHLRRSARARRMSLRVSRLDGRVTLTLPPHAPDHAAHDFLVERAGWIRGHLADFVPPETVAEGTRLHVEGVPVTVVPGPRSELRTADGVLVISRRTRSVPAAVASVLKARARDRLTAACDSYAAALRCGYARIVLRDPRSRWGSCSSAGALMFSWRLVLAPPAILDYVAAHEVAHLIEMNHAPAFWNLVEKLRPDYAAERAWLRENGAQLHRFRFTAPAS
jgi:predicted metal-dependent hydrolase